MSRYRSLTYILIYHKLNFEIVLKREICQTRFPGWTSLLNCWSKTSFTTVWDFLETTLILPEDKIRWALLGSKEREENEREVLNFILTNIKKK